MLGNFLLNAEYVYAKCRDEAIDDEIPLLWRGFTFAPQRQLEDCQINLMYSVFELIQIRISGFMKTGLFLLHPLLQAGLSKRFLCQIFR